VIVTEPTVSLFCRPAEENAVEPLPLVRVVPKTLFALSAVMVNGAAVMLADREEGWVRA
jgi:hypothetical protein